MEVEPSIINIFIFDIINQLVELFTDSVLRAFFVNEINTVLFSINLLGLSKMSSCGISTVIEIRNDVDLGTPF